MSTSLHKPTYFIKKKEIHPPLSQQIKPKMIWSEVIDSDKSHLNYISAGFPFNFLGVKKEDINDISYNIPRLEIPWLIATIRHCVNPFGFSILGKQYFKRISIKKTWTSFIKMFGKKRVGGEILERYLNASI